MGLRTMSLMVQTVMMYLTAFILFRNLFRVFQQTRCPNFVLTFVGGVEMMIYQYFSRNTVGNPDSCYLQVFSWIELLSLICTFCSVLLAVIYRSCYPGEAPMLMCIDLTIIKIFLFFNQLIDWFCNLLVPSRFPNNYLGRSESGGIL